MPHPLSPYLNGFTITDNLETDVKALLCQHQQEHVYYHVKAVAAKASELAEMVSGDREKVKISAWLHDISAIIPNEQRIGLAKALRIEVLPEEEQFPMIIHQKLSAAIARETFKISDETILSAIGCHTTLKADASLSDHIVFVADKIAWDQTGTPPYIAELLKGLEYSVEAASLAYLEYLWSIRENLRVLHPWAIAAREQLLT